MQYIWWKKIITGYKMTWTWAGNYGRGSNRFAALWKGTSKVAVSAEMSCQNVSVCRCVKLPSEAELIRWLRSGYVPAYFISYICVQWSLVCVIPIYTKYWFCFFNCFLLLLFCILRSCNFNKDVIFIRKYKCYLGYVLCNSK